MFIEEFESGRMWAIPPFHLEGMLNWHSGTSFEKTSVLHALESVLGKSKAPVDVKGKVVIIPIRGPITKRETFFSVLFGGTSIDSISSALNVAAAHKDVAGILLDIDSPGGTIDGLASLSDQIYGLRGKKTVIAFANDQMTSAAFWIGSAAQAVITPKTASIGSLGVMMVHTDLSKADEQAGVKRTYLKAGQYKALGNSAEPLGTQGRQYFEAQLDYYYSIFVEQVARNRGVSVKTVLTNMADGKIFIGQQAVDAGLADSIGYFDDAVSAAGSLLSVNMNQLDQQTTKEKKRMPYNQKPETFEQLVAYFVDEKNMTKSEAIQKAMARAPELHEDYLRRANSGGRLEKI